MTNRITSEVKDVLGGARAGTNAVTQQLYSFLGNMPKIPGLMDGQLGNMNLMPNFNMPSIPNVNLPSFNPSNYGNLMGLGGSAGVQAPPVQAEGVANPYEELLANLGSYHNQ